MVQEGFIQGAIKFNGGMPVAIAVEVGLSGDAYLVACRDTTRPSGSVVELGAIYETETACLLATIRQLANQAGKALGDLAFLVVGSAAHAVYVTRCNELRGLMVQAIKADALSMDDVYTAIRPVPNAQSILLTVGTPTNV